MLFLDCCEKTHCIFAVIGFLILKLGWQWNNFQFLIDDGDSVYSYAATLHSNGLQINSSALENDCRVGDDIFKCIAANENVWLLIEISLKFVPKTVIDNNPALIEIIARHRIDGKPLSEPMLTQFTDAYMRDYGEMSKLIYLSENYKLVLS